jgi:anionic cell wall polymer biosynthesis LytR-Cps2A-Psr (LCP) family protein
MIFVAALWNITKRFEHLDTEVSKRPMAMKGSVVNILLIGQDARDGESGQRTDSMILLSVNTKKNSVAMTSIMRDTYVEIPGYGGDRINAA